MPVEATENVAPIIIWRKELKPDSGGAGQTRGGAGQIMEIGTKGDQEFSVNASFDRIANAPKGRDGGLEGARGVVKLKSGAALRTKGYQIVPDGDRLILELPGGAGMGFPVSRDPELVAQDVRDGLVSEKNARLMYRVAVDPDGRPDLIATATLRA
jgi:N-methylhydantoinase B